MAISVVRLNQLMEEFVPVKTKIDKIDRKYSLDYREPILDMPESLNLPKLTYAAKTERQLRDEAELNVKAAYLSKLNSLEARYALKYAELDRRKRTIDEKARAEQARYLADFTKSTASLRQRLVDNGMLFSSVIDRTIARLRVEYEQKVTESNASADNKNAAAEQERQGLESRYADEKAAVEKERSAKTDEEYASLVKKEQDKKTSVDKYNMALDEKEKKYLMARAKALENAKEAEYERSFAAQKLYQQMGATGYEQAKLWEKYNVMVNHFATFRVREEAMAVINYDSYVQMHLQQYFSTLVDWVKRNVPE